MKKIQICALFLLLAGCVRAELSKEFQIKTPQNESLSITVDGLNNVGKKKLAFVQHGLASDSQHPAVQEVKKAFIETGYVVISFDSRYSLGKSDGNVEKARLSTFTQDLNSVIHWGKTQGFYSEPFALAGHSLGGASVLQYSWNNPQKVNLLIGIAPVISGKLWEKSCTVNMPEFCQKWKAEGLYKYQDTAHFGKEVLISYQVIEKAKNYDALSHAGKIQSPILLIAADQDIIIAPKDIRLLFDNLKTPKQISIIPNSDHNFNTQQNQKDLYQAAKAFLTIDQPN